VFPSLRPLVGFRGARLLQRDVDGEVEVVVETEWDSLDAVRAFAGDTLDCAVVEPEAQRVLARWDGHVTHHAVRRSISR